MPALVDLASKAILRETRFPQNAEAVKGVFPTMDGSPFLG
jgi:hypothetical protein